MQTEVNFNIKSTITEGGIGMVQPKAAKGGVFSHADIPLIKRALDHYKTTFVQTEVSERETSNELTQLANLMHRLNNRI